jgi:hypothetical protein
MSIKAKKQRAKARLKAKINKQMSLGFKEFKDIIKPKGLGNGQAKIERFKREPFYNGSGAYLTRNMGQANLKVFINKAVNKQLSRPDYAHLTLRYI